MTMVTEILQHKPKNVVIDDITAPVADVATLSDVTAECSVTSLTAPTATDNCAGTVTVTNNATLPITAQGTTVVTWTYDDGNGNTSTQNQNVVIDDITNPVTPTLADVTGECSATATAPTTTDNCAGTITGTTSDPLTYTTQGTYTITWNFDDGNGNDIDVTQNVVIEDVTNPVADVATLSDITAECSVSSLTAPTATDNCAGTVTVTNNVTLPITAQGTTVVTWTYDDGNGNTSTQTQDVVIEDVTAPVADVATLSDITDECEVATLTAPTATDNCAGTVTVTNNVTLPITAQGTTVVTWTYDDGNGNTSTQNQNVVIDDIINPSISCIEDQVIYLNESETFYTVQGTEFDPTTTEDNCGIASVLNDFNTTSTLENAQLNIGTHPIIWTITDNAGNTATCSFDVTVNAFNGIADLSANGISIYPNPTTGVINLTVFAEPVSVKITDITGKTLQSFSGSQIDISNLQNGIYFLKIETVKGVFVKKIIKY